MPSRRRVVGQLRAIILTSAVATVLLWPSIDSPSVAQWLIERFMVLLVAVTVALLMR
jgi:cation transport ATPase